jgi:hypothetical protein
MVRTLKLCLLAGFFVVLGGFGLRGLAQDVPAERVYKNIQALKGIPAGQIPNIMSAYNAALGVNCDYCHTMGALEKADKPAHKLALRDIQMTRDINQRYKMQLDCIHCHQGKAKPSLVASTGPRPGPGPGTDPGPGKTTPGPGPSGPTGPAKTEAMPPGDNVVFKGKPPAYPDVPFPHERHTSAVTDCAKCHHTGENNKCSTCHLTNRRAGPATKINSYEIAHNRTSARACWGCHIQMKTGPAACAACHKK